MADAESITGSVSIGEPNLGSRLDLARFTPVNHLWPELVERLGLERSGRAVQQALDLQAMHGTAATLPLLLVETCGLALVQAEQLRLQTGLVGAGERLVLLLSQRQSTLQLLRHS
jgi:hypothetical protein